MAQLVGTTGAELQGARAYRLAIAQGFGAMVLFSLTVPMTKLALAGLDPNWLTANRTLLAGLGALVWLVWERPRRPNRAECGWLLLGGLGVVVGFPWLLAHSLTRVDASAMGVVLAGLPLCTSLAATVLLKERHQALFWLFALAGAGALVAYYLVGLREGIHIGEPGHFALLAVATLLSAGVGYAAGAKAASSLGGWHAICWMLVLYLPVSALAFGYFGGTATNVTGAGHGAQDWLVVCLALGYLALVSQWLGFRYWYGAMTVAGAGTISQLQLLQPFFTLLFAATLLGELVQGEQLFFVLLVGLAVAGAMRHP